jgi:O-antigen/teichoic acid export membrane protein
MLRAFFRDSFLYGAAGLLSRGLSVLLVPLYTRVLSPADFGALDMLMAFGALVNLTVALEVTQGVARHYPEASTPEEKGRIASTALWFTLCAFSAFWAAGVLFAPELGALLLDSPEMAPLVRLSVAAIWAGGLFYFAQNQLRWQLQAARSAAISLLMSITTAAVSLYLVVVERIGVAGLLWGLLAGSAVGAAAGLYLTRASYRYGFDRGRLAVMLRFSIPLVPSSIAVFVAMYVDRFVIKELMTLRDVGLYGVGYRVATLAGLLMLGFQGALTPLVFAHYRKPETPGELARLFRYFVAFALIIVLGLSLFAPELLLVFTTPDYVEGAAVVPLLAPAVVLSGMYIFTPGLGIAKRTAGIAAITIVGAALNTALNFLLVPRLGIAGAALGSFSAALAVFAAYMAASQRLYPVPHRWGRLAAAVLACAAVSMAAPHLRLGFAAGIAAKAGLLAAATALIVAAGLVEPRELRRGWGMLTRRGGPPGPRSVGGVAPSEGAG